MPGEDRSNGRAIYLRIADDLREEIASSLEPGVYLPSETGLAQQFGVNRHTIRRAIDELVHEGLIERQRGKGSRVLAPAFRYTLSPLLPFSQTVEAVGRTPSCTVLRGEIVRANARVARALGLRSQARVVALDLLRQVDGVPILLSRSTLSAARYGSVLTEYGGGSLHGFIRERFGERLVMRGSVFSVAMPTTEQATVLRMSRQIPLLCVESTIYSRQTEKPVEHVFMRFRGDAAELDLG
ncbi:MAG: phosphonate metabolism transcriptional regulator PhnF [Planctomycetota bacterium]